MNQNCSKSHAKSLADPSSNQLAQKLFNINALPSDFTKALGESMNLSILAAFCESLLVFHIAVIPKPQDKTPNRHFFLLLKKFKRFIWGEPAFPRGICEINLICNNKL